MTGRVTVAAGAVPRPPPERVRRRFGFVAGLFDTWLNAGVTLVLAWLIVRIALALWDWAIVRGVWQAETAEECARAGGMCWAFLADRWRLILFGPYPYAEQWRPALAMALFALLLGVSLSPRMWAAHRSRRVLAAAWPTAIVAIAGLLWGGVLGLVPVPSRLWGGLPLTMILASVGVAGAFVLAVLLALGRRSDMPVIRAVSAGFVEFFRGVPLIALLFLASVLFPYFVPPGWTMDVLLRAQIAFALFFAAYMAEAIRGGLQAIPRGQYAAAESLGLTYWQMQRCIILPQALRTVIPSLVNIFIAAFKDTSLVVVISMIDLLGAANASTAEAKWWGLYIEPYLFVAVIYLTICAIMSAYSRGLERRLGVGER